MGGFRGEEGGGQGGHAPIFFKKLKNKMKVTVFLVVLCNNPKDVHVL